VTNDNKGPGVSPYDTPWSSGFRFLIELVAWVAGPWAVADLTDAGWAAIPAALVLLGLPSVFNTPGDKNTTGVPTPGLIRIGIEAILLAAAVAGAWVVWPTWAAVAVSVVGALMIITGLRRYRWLAAGGGDYRLPDH